ncbi:MinD/ParA family protein [Porticoccus sp. W117]|uniref:MinD/ParA family protein n=1 Tax=Porticoccus sp. W117 TaxID=3054777 RepID=UPI002596F3D1|nr:MinD/ParA family protein [Porticoccus sp. W117]MDM3870973.1 MinD/ParA family protein [Porticoccus sp. W117]
MTRQGPVKVIAVTGAKGGVGKTNVSVNLAACFAELGNQVMLMDADLGLANVDVLLGLHANYDLRHVISGERTLEEIIIDGPRGIKIVPAASGVSRMAELSNAEHVGLIRAFSELALPVDVLLVDTAAGISDSVVSFSKAAQEVLVVVCDEPTSITDAYALIKVLSRDHGVERFHILANMVKDKVQGEQLFSKISRVAERFLDVSLLYLGAVPFDEQLRKSVQRQVAVVESAPRSKASRAFHRVAEQVNNWPMPDAASGKLEFFVERLLYAGDYGGGNTEGFG